MFSPSKINHLECLKRILVIVRVIHWLVHSFILQIFVSPYSSSLESLYTRANRPRPSAFSRGPTKRYLACGRNTGFSCSYQTSFVLLFLPLHFSFFCKSCQKWTLEKTCEHCEKWTLLPAAACFSGSPVHVVPAGCQALCWAENVVLYILNLLWSPAPQRQLSLLAESYPLLNHKPTPQGRSKVAHRCSEIDKTFVSLSTFTSHHTHHKIFHSFLLQLKIVHSHENRDKCAEWEWWSLEVGVDGVIYTSDGVLFYILFTCKVKGLLKTHYSLWS